MLFDQETGRHSGERGGYTYNAGSVGNISSIMLAVAPELVPSVSLFTYTTLTDSTPAIRRVRRQSSKTTEVEGVDQPYPQKLLLLLEYYPYTQSLLASIVENIVDCGLPVDRRLVDHYPAFGYLRVHYLVQTVEPQGDFPEKLMSEMDVRAFLSAAGLNHTSEIGCHTEGFIDSTQAFDNFQHNFAFLTQYRMLSGIARYIPVQVGFAGWSALYRDVFSGFSSEYTLCKMMLFANRRCSTLYRDLYGTRKESTDLSAKQAAQKIEIEARIGRRSVDKSKRDVSAVTADFAYEQVGVPIRELIDMLFEAASDAQDRREQSRCNFIAYYKKRVGLFTIHIHLGEETFYPASIHKCLYLTFINKLKSLDVDPSRNPVGHLEKEVRIHHRASSPTTGVERGLFDIVSDLPAEFKDLGAEQLKEVLGEEKYGLLSQMAQVAWQGYKTQIPFDTFLQNPSVQAIWDTPNALTMSSFSGVSIPISGGAFQRLGGALSQAILAPAQNAILFFPSLQFVFGSISTVQDLINDPKNIFYWNALLAQGSSGVHAGLTLASYFSTVAPFVLSQATPVLSAVTSFTTLVRDLKVLKQLQHKKKGMQQVLSLIVNALTVAQRNDLDVRLNYGADLSANLKALVQSDLAELQKLVEFLMERYDIAIHEAKLTVTIDSINLGIAIFCGALAFVTAGATLAVATLPGSAISLTRQAIQSPLRLNRYVYKSLEYNIEYAKVQQGVVGQSVSDSMLSKRDLFLLDQAKELSGKSALQFQVASRMTLGHLSDTKQEKFAELERLGGHIVSGATIDDYKRIKLAAFILSSFVRNQYYQQLTLENPEVAAYLGIAQAMGECIDFKPDAPEVQAILSTPFSMTASLAYYGSAKKSVDNAYHTALKVVARKVQ